MQNQMKEVKNQLQNAKQISIVSHVSPDGDAIGSSLGLYHYLKSINIAAQIIVPNAFPNFLAWLPDSETILLYDENKEKAQEILQKTDVLFCLDFNETSRTAFMQEAVDNAPAFKILIDHHIGNPQWQDANFCVVGASSTCELVYDFIKEHSQSNHFLNQDIAYALYTGLLTDTGNFQFSATTPKVHIIAAHLMEAGVLPDVVHNYINNSFDIDRLQFFGYCVSEKMKIIPEKKIGVYSSYYKRTA
ncbi:MAG: DHH family phosphoesterase [Chitinophagales bacterium]|nr:DHH family phosphoesterase [Chitinophagales bacterium]